MTYFIQSNEDTCRVLHAVFRLQGDGELEWLATLDDMVGAERLVETLDWEWPGNYVIRHVLVDKRQNSIQQRLLL